MRKLDVQLFGALALSLALTAAHADGGGGDGGGGGEGRSWGERDRFAPVREVMALGDYTTAIEKLDVLLAADAEDADTLNLLGFAHRKQGRLAEALDYYLAALRLEPEHRGANEYLGELFLETGQLAKAEERLAVLDDACFFPCSEYTDLKQAIERYKQARAAK